MDLHLDLIGQKINLDVIAIIKFIDKRREKYEKVIEHQKKRAVFVKDQMEHLKFTLSQQNVILNILIFNLEQESIIDIQKEYEYWSLPFDGTTYGFWLFKTGSAKNLGQGGFANWCMYGKFAHVQPIKYDEGGYLVSMSSKSTRISERGPIQSFEGDGYIVDFNQSNFPKF